MKTLTVGLLLAFLLFTPQGHFAAEMALEAAVGALADPTPPAPPLRTAEEVAACKKAWLTAHPAVAAESPAYRYVPCSLTP